MHLSEDAEALDAGFNGADTAAKIPTLPTDLQKELEKSMVQSEHRGPKKQMKNDRTS